MKFVVVSRDNELEDLKQNEIVDIEDLKDFIEFCLKHGRVKIVPPGINGGLFEDNSKNDIHMLCFQNDYD